MQTTAPPPPYQAWQGMDDDMDVSPTPLGMVNSHFLDRIEDTGLYKTMCKQAADQPAAGPCKPRVKLHATVSVSMLSDINTAGGSFKVALRLYLLWEADLHAVGLGHLADKALGKGHYHAASQEEYDEIQRKTPVPSVCIFNPMSVEETDVPMIRVYGGREGATALMWNQSYVAVCREEFELRTFPFDTQRLTIELRQKNGNTWDLFDLCVNTIQFHRFALEHAEWVVHEPHLERASGSQKEKACKIHLSVSRCWCYYLQNIVLTMFMLSLLTLLSFGMDVMAVGDRVSTGLTIILTAVAFKFVLVGELPKVPYNTALDLYILWANISLQIITALTVVPSFVQDDDVAAYLNRVLMCVSATLVVAGLLVWGVSIVFIRLRYKASPAIPVHASKTWYAFKFAVPVFLSYND